MRREREKREREIKTTGKITREMVSTVRKEGTVNQRGVKIRYTIAVSFFFFFARASAFGPHCTLAVNTLWLKRKVTARTTRSLVCYTAVFRVVKQCSSPLRDDTKNGCVAGYSKSRGKTTDKQRLFLIITIDMLSFRALLSFLSHYCACHIQAMQLRLVSSRTGRRGVISDLDCIF